MLKQLLYLMFVKFVSYCVALENDTVSLPATLMRHYNVAQNERSSAEHKWVSLKQYDPLPAAAVVGGYENGFSMYVGRASHNGGVLPAKILPQRGLAYVSSGGKEYAKSNYEALVGEGYTWTENFDGHVAQNAVSSGKSPDGEALFVGRGLFKNSLTIGKIVPSHGCLYIPYGGAEKYIQKYETLVRNRCNV